MRRRLGLFVLLLTTVPAPVLAQVDGSTEALPASEDAATPTEPPVEAPEAAPPSTLPPPTESELEDARHSFEVGAAAFENGDYETAASEFRTALELSRHPALLYNIYLAEERAGRPGEAAVMLERYLESDLPTAEERTVLERRLDRLRTRAASRGPVVDPAESEADRAALIVAPTDQRTGEAWVLPPAPGGPPIPGIALLITGGVLLAGFAVLAPLSEVEDQRLAGTCGRSVGSFCTGDEVAALTGLNIAADVSWIAGAISAGVGLVLLFALPPERAERAASPAVALVPTVGPGQLGLLAGGRF